MLKTLAFAAGLMATMTEAIELKDFIVGAAAKIKVFEGAGCTGKKLMLNANNPFTVTDRITNAIDELQSAEIPVGMKLRIMYTIDGVTNNFGPDLSFEVIGNGSCMNPIAWAIAHNVEGFDDLARIQIFKGIALAN